MDAKKRERIKKALSDPDAITLIRVALKKMLDFWYAKRQIEDLLLTKVSGVVKDDFGIDELFENMGGAGMDCDDDTEVIEEFIAAHAEHTL